MTREEQQRAIRLYEELHALRERARLLPYEAIERWELSLRAGAIGQELKSITGERPRVAP